MTHSTEQSCLSALLCFSRDTQSTSLDAQCSSYIKELQVGACAVGVPPCSLLHLCIHEWCYAAVYCVLSLLLQEFISRIVTEFVSKFKFIPDARHQ